MSDTDRPWSNLGFAEEAAVYVSASQNARVLTEGWIAANAFCPSCGAEALRPFPNNSPVADFGCPNCAEEYELKAKRGRLGPKVVNGAYGAMTARLEARNNPSLLVMAYDRSRTRVTDLIVVPRDKIVGMERRIDSEDPYFRDLGRRWSEALAAAHRNMPDPTWLDLDLKPAPRNMTIVS